MKMHTARILSILLLTSTAPFAQVDSENGSYDSLQQHLNRKDFLAAKADLEFMARADGKSTDGQAVDYVLQQGLEAARGALDKLHELQADAAAQSEHLITLSRAFEPSRVPPELFTLMLEAAIALREADTESANAYVDRIRKLYPDQQDFRRIAASWKTSAEVGANPSATTQKLPKPLEALGTQVPPPSVTTAAPSADISRPLAAFVVLLAFAMLAHCGIGFYLYRYLKNDHDVLANNIYGLAREVSGVRDGYNHLKSQVKRLDGEVQEHKAETATRRERLGSPSTLFGDLDARLTALEDLQKLDSQQKPLSMAQIKEEIQREIACLTESFGLGSIRQIKSQLNSLQEVIEKKNAHEQSVKALDVPGIIAEVERCESQLQELLPKSYHDFSSFSQLFRHIEALEQEAEKLLGPGRPFAEYAAASSATAATTPSALSTPQREQLIMFDTALRAGELLTRFAEYKSTLKRFIDEPGTNTDEVVRIQRELAGQGKRLQIATRQLRVSGSPTPEALSGLREAAEEKLLDTWAGVFKAKCEGKVSDDDLREPSKLLRALDIVPMAIKPMASCFEDMRHDTGFESRSDLPAGTIIRIEKLGFERISGKVIRKAKVITNQR